MFIMLLDILQILLTVALTIIIVQAIMSWLLAFNVINLQNDIVRSIWTALDGLTAPLYNPIRKIMPDFGAIDLTPMVVIIGILIMQGPVSQALYRLAY